MGIPLSEDPRAAGVDPETPAQDATEGLATPSGATLTYTYDLTTAGIPREAQRILSVAVSYGASPAFDHLRASGSTTNLGKWWIDAARRKLYDVIRKMIRLQFILGPDAGAYAPGWSLNAFVAKYTFPATGSSTTTSITNYSTADLRDMGGGGVTPYVDYAFCDTGSQTDLTLITGASIGDSSGSITTVKPLHPASWSNTVTIVKPTTYPTFPIIREDRTLLCERQETAWIAKASFASDYTFSSKRCAYPLKWAFYAGGSVQFQGTFRVLASETNTGDGVGVVDLTEQILGATPETGYDYPNFPAVSGNLKFQNDGAGFKTTLNLTGVTIAGSKAYIKVIYCEEIADPATPDSDTISPTQTSCKFDIIPPANAAINGYTGSGDILDVFDSGHFCTEYASLNAAEVAAFRLYCNNTTCRSFQVHNPYTPQPEDINLFWGGRGVYFLQSDPGDPAQIVGRDDHDGILTYCGLPVYSADGLYIADKDLVNHAAFLERTGDQDANGYDIFFTWQNAVDDAGSPTDALGVFGAITAHTSKKDPAGAKEANKALDDRSGYLAGYAFENIVGNRRIGYTTQALASAPSGPGLAEVQRARAVRHTSQTFSRSFTGGGEMTDGLTKITFLATAITIGALACDTKFELPKTGERVADEKSTHDKGLSRAIFSSSSSGNLLFLNIALGTTNQVTLPGAGQVGSHDYDSGGLFASGENAWQDQNPGSTFLFGSRQERCTVGDVLTIEGLECQVVATRVLNASNVTQTSPTPEAPTAGVPGLTSEISSYYNKCDLVVCSLEGQDGDALVALGSLAGKTVTSVKHSAVAPPQFYYDGSEASSGYEPVVTCTDMLDTVTPFQKTVLTPGTHYEWEPTSGTLWVKRSALPYDSDVRLHFQGYVYDTRVTLYAEDFTNMTKAFEDMLDEGFLDDASATDAGVDVSLVLDNGVDPVEDFLSITPNDSVEPPPGYDDWDFPDDSEVLVHESSTKFDGDDLAWHVFSGFYEVGGRINNLAFFPDNLEFACRFPVHFLPVIPRLHEDELVECLLDLSLTTGQMRREWYFLDRTVEPIDIDSGSEITDDDVDIKVIVAWYSEAGGVVTLVKADDALSIETTLKKITDGGTDYLRATVDVTKCQKAAIASQGDNIGDTLVFIPFPAEAIPDSFDLAGTSITDFVYSSADIYNASDYVGSDPDFLNIQTWRLEFDAMDLGQMRFRINKDGLKTADWYAEDGGMTGSPLLDWTAP